MKLIDTHDHILSAFDRDIAAYATRHFSRTGIELVLNCRVSFCFRLYGSSMNPMHTLPTGLCISLAATVFSLMSLKLSGNARGQYWRIVDHLVLKVIKYS